MIDVGSGKGYLCSFLSMQFNLQVFGIDSSSTNTHGAQERNRKLKKFSRAYKKHNHEKNHEPSNNRGDGTTNCVTEDKGLLVAPSESCASQEQVTGDISPSNKGIECTIDQNDCDAGSGFLNMLSLDVVEDGSPRVHPSQLSEEEKEKRKRENLERKAREGKRNGSDDTLFSPLTSYVTAETELKTLITELQVREHSIFAPYII